MNINDNSGYLTGGLNNENEIDKLFGDIDQDADINKINEIVLNKFKEILARVLYWWTKTRTKYLIFNLIWNIILTIKKAT